MVWPEILVDDIARRKCVLFLGSGISANASNDLGLHPPTWRKFLEDGAKRIVDDDACKECVEECISKNQFLLACDLIKRKLGNDDFGLLLDREFVTPGFKEDEIHKTIYDLDSRIVITPNFDQIYDTYAKYISQNNTIVKQYYDSDLSSFLRGNYRIIIKNHGTIDTKDKIIFTKADYANARIYHSGFYKIMESLILTNSFVFLGAGLNDPDIQLLFENYSRMFSLSPSHFFIIPQGVYTEYELEVYKDTMNMSFVPYDNSDNQHTELKIGLKKLKELVETKREEVCNMMSW